MNKTYLPASFLAATLVAFNLQAQTAFTAVLADLQAGGNEFVLLEAGEFLGNR